MFDFFKKQNKKTTGDELTEKSVEGKDIKLDEDIIIHSMPEKFRSTQIGANSAKKTGLIIIIVGIIFLAIIAVGIYYYFFALQDTKIKSETTTAPAKIEAKKSKEPAQKPSQPQKPKTAIKIEKQPKEVYLEIRQEMDKINTFTGYEQLIKKYGSKDSIIGLNKQKKEYSNLSSSQKIEFIASLTHSEQSIKDIKETKSGNIARLYLEIEGLREKAIITIVLENNEWKLENEIWPEIKKDDSAGLENFMASDDADNDGLTDKEEILFGCDANSADTDDDGYGDLDEIMNLYNPAGNDRLIDSLNISRYSNIKFKYSLFYPAVWSSNNTNEDDSVMFRSNDNQFVQVIAQVNENKEPISSWYKAQFNADKIDSNKLIISKHWQGIKTDNGLTIYLTDKQYNNIIIITYIPSASNFLDYINILEMAIRSLEVGEL